MTDTTITDDAIAAKIKAQAEYVCWRDGKVVPSRKMGKQKKNDGVSAQKPQKLPAADPGTLIAHRWRKSFCHKGHRAPACAPIPAPLADGPSPANASPRAALPDL
jgi:hypothetical protein